MGNITSIQKALDITLKQFGLDNSIDVALTNIDKKTDTSIPFLQGIRIPTGTEPADLGATDKREGIYQINIRYEPHIGTTPFTDMADLVNETFKPGACFYHGGLCVMIDLFEDGDILTSDGWSVMPLSITWSAWTAKI